MIGIAIRHDAPWTNYQDTQMVFGVSTATQCDRNMVAFMHAPSRYIHKTDSLLEKPQVCVGALSM